MKKPKIECDSDILISTYQLESIFKSPLLDNWLNATYHLEDFQLKAIERLSKNYEREGDSWNEEELKVRFIALVIEIVNIDEEGKIKLFLERNISAEVGDYQISVNVDLMFAGQIGRNTPSHPYFFLQELKKGKKSTNDPEGQMLAAMIASQSINNDNKPIYGAYQVGRNWIFGILFENEYHISRQFDVSNPIDLKSSIFNLKRIKDLVLA
jgi:transcriptional antiterminator